LIACARRSRGDEFRHARDVGALARRFGAAVPPVEVAPMKKHTLVEIAIENAPEA